MVKRLGLPNPMKRVLPSALGATEEPLIDMTSAYSAFSNMGTRVKPHLIRQVSDSDGTVKFSWERDVQEKSFEAVSPYVASQMQEIMRAVVEGGTAGSINGSKELANRMICGKTGTVNDFTDAWFIGYTPTYTTGVWIGYPGLKKSLGNKEAGSVAALPMWIQFMEKFLKDKPNDRFQKAPPPDREIVARRSEVERKMAEAAAKEAETQATDDTAEKVKDVVEEEAPAAEPGAPPVPRMTQPESGAPPRIDRGGPPRTERPRTNEGAPGRSSGDKKDEKKDKKEEKKKRGKNG
jgi:penicillin-binding protein 1A